jgi:hypothetical protein
MSGTMEAAVVGLGLFAPGHPTLAHFLSEPASSEAQVPKGAFLDPRNRRRASVVTRALADVYGQALEGSGLDVTQVASVFGSALGEAQTMISILDQIFREQGPVSPMKFVTSVHNTAAGLASIASKNQGFATSIGADFDTPAMALAEAMGLAVARGMPAVVACGEEAAPEGLIPDATSWGLFAGALALAPVEAAPEGAMRVRAFVEGAPTVPFADVPPALAQSPVTGMLDLVVALARRNEGFLRLDRGQGRGFTVELVPPANE